jgi:hypothetical protein
MQGSKPWSKLKSRVEALWASDLRMSIHCTSYPFSTPGPAVRVSRHWITLDKATVWDFPGPFLSETRSRGGPVRDGYPGFANGGSVIGELLRDYLDRARDKLFDPFALDHWELTDILKAADRRLGREVLMAWGGALDAEHPARPILAKRF